MSDYYARAVAESDTRNDLLSKIKALSALNRETLESVKDREGERVIVAYERSLICRADDWSLETTARDDPVSALLRTWRYDGEPLEQEPLLKDYDTTLRRYEDVGRCVDALERLYETYAEITSESPRVRAGLRTLLTNCERLQVALGGLHGATLDATLDDGFDEDAVRGHAEALVRAFDGLRAHLPRAELRLTARDGRAEEEETTPRFRDPASLRRPTRVLEYGSGASALAYCGSRLAVGGDDGILRLWTISDDDASTPPPPTLLNGHDGGVRALASYRASDDAVTLLASAGTDRSVRIWDPSTNALVHHRAECHDGTIWSLVAFARGHVERRPCLASAGFDRVVKLWSCGRDGATLTPLAVLRGHTDEVVALAALPPREDVARLASGGGDRAIRIWSLAHDDDGDRASCVAVLAGHSGDVLCLAAWRDGDRDRLASGGHDRDVRVWDVTKTDDAVADRVNAPLRGHDRGVRSLALLPRVGNESPLIASGGWDRRLCLWDPDSGTRVAARDDHDGGVTALLPFEDDAGEARLASASTDQRVMVWRDRGGEGDEPFTTAC